MATAQRRAERRARLWLPAAVAAGVFGIAATNARAETPDELAPQAHQSDGRTVGMTPPTITVISALTPAPSVVAGKRGTAGAPGALDPAGTDVETRHPLHTALYGSYLVLNALDTHSTLLAKSRGARELNPVLNGLGGSSTATVTVKAGMAAVTLFAASRLARTHPRASFVTMVALNSAYAVIVAHNYQVARAIRP